MKKGLIGILSLLLITVMAGCGSEPVENSATETRRDREREDVPAPAAEGSGTTTEAAVTEAAPVEAAPVEAMKEEAAAPAAGDGLVGTKWVYDEITLEFKEGNMVFLKGGPLMALAPDGTDAAYTLDGEAFEVTVLGQVYSGSFDGTKLMVDGKEAVKQ